MAGSCAARIEGEAEDAKSDGSRRRRAGWAGECHQGMARCAPCRKNHARRARSRSDWWAHPRSSEWMSSAVAEERVDHAR